MEPENNGGSKSEELAALAQEIRDRVRARYPQRDSSRLNLPLPDLTALVHARDAAEAKVASIGTVNPRRGGPLNSLVQAMKRTIARGLDWHVREQVEFNRGVMSCVESALEALNETKRALSILAGQLEDMNELRDMRSHWAQWRAEWEHKLFLNETRFLRSVADLQGAFQHRASLMEANFRDITRSQHADYAGALDRSVLETQKRFWEEVGKVRLEYERVIHEELRLVRQRARAEPRAEAAPAPSPPAEPAPEFDYGRFAERFRGGEDFVRQSVELYLPRFEGRAPVLDLGCGRGEFLEMLRGAGIAARGVDLSAESVSLCRGKGLDVEQADLFAYLSDLPGKSLGGVFCAQVVEHLPPARLPEMIRLVSEKLSTGGLLAIETPNPECLAIFASHFYLDPTHTRPVPHPLVSFYLQECGFGGIEVQRLSPAVESMPALASLPEDFRNAFFGGLDYAIFGIRL
ncbi:MAG TPA: class I SAM-dependent methyltransferase [Bryobacteraceae bacterium]|nr:class I SAM-dependent methyltransferase [Bryobacteraceae bacterium]